MSVDKGSESAFPRRYRIGTISDKDGVEEVFGYEPGLTKREYFAGLAMAAMSMNEAFNNNQPEELAKFAVIDADALLAALEAKP